MSLRTRMLVTAFGVMGAVLTVLTLNLATDALARSRAEQLRQGELVAAWIQDWIVDHREQFVTLAGDAQWGELSRRISQSLLVTDWVVGAPSGNGIALLAAHNPSTESLRPAWEACLLQALQDRRVILRGDWVATPLAFPDGRRAGIALALPSVAAVRPDLAGTFARMAWVMMLGTALLLLVMFVLLQRFVLRPMEALLMGAERVARGDFSRPVPSPVRYDEMTTLIRSFNGMMERLAEQQRSVEADMARTHGALKDTERKLVVAQRLSSTGTLAAGIAHEINNPLGGLLNAARALQTRDGNDPRVRSYTGLILEGLERIQATVQRLLQFVPRTAATQPFVLADAVDRAAALCEHRLRERGARLSVSVPRGLPPLVGDAGEVQQAVLNVLLNALDATEPGRGEIRITAQESEGQALLIITDNGGGMPAEVLQRAADPFYTTKPQGAGTGLGLAVVQSIMEHHGGTLGLASDPGRGTEITLAFPRLAPAPAPSALP